MPDNGVVVVLEGNEDARNLVRSLTRWGYSVIVVSSMLKALDRIEHYDLSAAIVNGNDAIDALEFVLNVREIDDRLPIIIVRSSLDSNENRILSERPRVFFISTNSEEYQPEVRATLANLAE